MQPANLMKEGNATCQPDDESRQRNLMKEGNATCQPDDESRQCNLMKEGNVNSASIWRELITESSLLSYATIPHYATPPALCNSSRTCTMQLLPHYATPPAPALCNSSRTMQLLPHPHYALLCHVPLTHTHSHTFTCNFPALFSDAPWATKSSRKAMMAACCSFPGWGKYPHWYR